jgi:hypothetical protein
MELSATLQVADAGATSVTGLQVNPFNAGGLMPMLAPTLDVGTEVPAKSAAAPLASCTADDVAVVEVETVRETVATTPFEIGVSFRPYKMHVSVPGALVQVMLLFALAPAVPSWTLIDEKSTVE